MWRVGWVGGDPGAPDVLYDLVPGRGLYVWDTLSLSLILVSYLEKPN